MTSLNEREMENGDFYDNDEWYSYKLSLVRQLLPTLITLNPVSAVDNAVRYADMMIEKLKKDLGHER